MHCPGVSLYEGCVARCRIWESGSGGFGSGGGSGSGPGIGGVGVGGGSGGGNGLGGWGSVVMSLRFPVGRSSETRATMTLAAKNVLEAVQPTDVAAPLVRRKRLRRNLLLSSGETLLEARPLFLRCPAPGKQCPRLVRCQAATGQRPAVQVFLELLLRVFGGRLRHGGALSARAVAWVVSVRVAILDRAVRPVDYMVGLAALSLGSAGRNRLLVRGVRLETGSVPSFDLVPPAPLGAQRVDESLSHGPLLAARLDVEVPAGPSSEPPTSSESFRPPPLELAKQDAAELCEVGRGSSSAARMVSRSEISRARIFVWRHEIGHARLGHSANDMLGGEEQERQARDLAASWGFDGIGTRPPSD